MKDECEICGLTNPADANRTMSGAEKVVVATNYLLGVTACQ